MKDTLKTNMNNIVQKAKKKRLFRRILAVLCALNVLITMSSLRSPADTLTTELNEAVGIQSVEHGEADEIELPVEDATIELIAERIEAENAAEMAGLEPPVEEAGVIELADFDEEKTVDVGEVSADPVYDLNGDSEVCLSAVLRRTHPEIGIEAVDSVEESAASDGPPSVRVEREAEDFRITALRDFIDDDTVALTVYTAEGGAYPVELKNGIEYTAFSILAEEQDGDELSPAEPVESAETVQLIETDCKTFNIDVSALDAPYSLNALLGMADLDGFDVTEAILSCDEALFAVEKTEADCLITPLKPFTSAAIRVEHGDIWVLSLMNEPETETEEAVTFPAQTFEAHVDGMAVYVRADEGAFPEGTAMSVAPIQDEATLGDIASSVEGDGTAVRRVHAVDITFRNAQGDEIEPLIPISVRMDVEALENSGDAVVVHVDSEGNTEVVEQAAAEYAPEMAVMFDAEAFSVYAVVITERYITADGQTWNIQVTYGADSGIPDGSRLIVREIEDDEYQAYLDQAAKNLPGCVISSARFFDISIMNGDAEIQPDTPVEVKVTMAQGEGQPQAVHFGDAVEIIDEVRQEQSGVVFEAGSFSVYGIVYTVDFEYEGNGFSIPGGTWVWLSDILDELRTPFRVADLRDVAFTNADYIAVEYVTGTEPGDEGLYDWRLTSLCPFLTQEKLILTALDGRVYVINVTDPENGEITHTSDLSKLLQNMTFYIDGEEVLTYVPGQEPLSQYTTVQVRDGMLYDLVINLKEGLTWQFSDTEQMYFQLPDGFTLPKDYSDTLTINLGLDGKVYGNPLSYDATNNRVLLDWNRQDRRYQRLIAAGNLRFSLNLQGYITPGELDFLGYKLFDVERYDPHNASVSKTGLLNSDDWANQYITYTVKVTSDGSTEGLTLTDVMGSALAYKIDGTTPLKWSRESLMSTQAEARRVPETAVGTAETPDAPYYSYTDTGDLYIHLPDTHDGDVITLTYRADVDYTKIAFSGNASVNEMGNTVMLQGDDNIIDNIAEFHQKEVAYSDMLKSVSRPSGRYMEGDREYQNIGWTIYTNDVRLISFAGSDITDVTRAYTNFQNDPAPYALPMEYIGDGITIEVYEWFGQDDRLVETRYVGWDSLETSEDLDATKGWTYHVPTDDGLYKYVITYRTRADVTGLPEDVLVENTANSRGGKDQVSVILHPKGSGLAVTKSVIAQTMDEVTWGIDVVISEAENGCDYRLVVEDALPYLWRLDVTSENKSYRFREMYVPGSLTVSGIHGTESYEVHVSEYEYETYELDANGSPTVTEQFKANQGSNFRNQWRYLPNGSTPDADANDNNYYYIDSNGKQQTGYTINDASRNAIYIEFYQDAEKTKPGLLAPEGGGDSRALHIELKTKINKDWVQKTWERYGYNAIWNGMRHTNDAYANTTHEQAQVIASGNHLVKSYKESPSWSMTTFGAPTYRFETYISGKYPGDTIVIDDYFDADLFVMRKKTDGTYGNVQFRAGNTPHYASAVSSAIDSSGKEYWVVGEYGSSVEDIGPGHVRFTIADLPLKSNGTAYAFYGINYFLEPKDEAAWSLIQDMAFEAGGIARFLNTAESEGLTDSDYFPVTLLPEFRPITKSDPTVPDQQNTVEYTITLNPQKKVLNNNEPIALDDSFDNLSVDYSTIAIQTEPAGRQNQVSYDFSGNTGYFTIPDATKVVITYKARVLPATDTEWEGTGEEQSADVTVRNVATMLGWSSGGDKSVRVNKASSADNYRIRLYKYGSGHMEQGLNGAVFGLYRNVTDNGGDPVKAPVRYGNTEYTQSQGIAGQPITFTTGDVYMLDGVIRAADEISIYMDEDEQGMFEELSPAQQTAYLNAHYKMAGYADVQLSQSLHGLYLMPGTTYYLKEKTVPVGYERDASVEYYAFAFGEIPQYNTDGAWQYFNNDILKVRNSPINGAFTLKKAIAGNYALSDAQKAALRFTVERQEGSVWTNVQENLTCDALMNGVRIDGISAGTYRVVETLTDPSLIPGSVTSTLSYTLDELPEPLTDGCAVFEITLNNIAEGQEHAVLLTNTYNRETLTLYAKKRWFNAEGNPATPTGAQVTLGVYTLSENTLSDEPVMTVTLDGAIDVESARVTGEYSSWSAQFANLPKKDEAGQDIAYVVKEISGTTGYDVSYGEDSTATWAPLADTTAASPATITNRQRSVSYTVSKAWTKPYWESASWELPGDAQIKIGVYNGATAQAAYQKYLDNARAYKEITLPIAGETDSAAWQAAFNNLPETDDQGQTYAWIAVETQSWPGFMADCDYLPLTDDVGANLTITNHTESVGVSVTKNWRKTLNGAWPDGTGIALNVTRHITYDDGGNSVTAQDTAFAPAYTVTRSGDALNVAPSGTALSWDGETAAAATATLLPNGGGTFTLAGLPKYGVLDGHAGQWEYRFTEDDMQGYTRTYLSGKAYEMSGGYIQNERQAVEISFKKTWQTRTHDDAEWIDGNKLVMALHTDFVYTDGQGARQTERVGTAEYVIQKTGSTYAITPSGLSYDADKDRFTVGNQPEFGMRNGAYGQFVYTWEEGDVLDSGDIALSYVHHSEPDGNDPGQTNYTNVPVETVSATVQKTWLDGAAEVSKALQVPVRVRLYHRVGNEYADGDAITVSGEKYAPMTHDATGHAVEDCEITSGDGWTATISRLPKYTDETDTVAERYIFREVAVYVDGAWQEGDAIATYYTQSHADAADAPGGTTVNNAPTTALTQTEVTVTKNWSDGNAHHTGETTTVRLYQAIDISALPNAFMLTQNVRWRFADGTPAPQHNSGWNYGAVKARNSNNSQIGENLTAAVGGGNIWEASKPGRIFIVNDPQEYPGVAKYSIGVTPLSTMTNPLGEVLGRQEPDAEITIDTIVGTYNYVLTEYYTEARSTQWRSEHPDTYVFDMSAVPGLPEDAIPTNMTRTLTPGQTVSFGALPTTLGDYPLRYYVVEEQVGSTAASIATAYSRSGDAWVITNTPTYTPFEINKIWKNGADTVDWPADSFGAQSMELTLGADFVPKSGGSATANALTPFVIRGIRPTTADGAWITQQINGKSYNLRLTVAKVGDGYTIRVDGLPYDTFLNDVEGRWRYFAVESAAPSGYAPSYANVGELASETLKAYDGGTVTNADTVDETDFLFEKVWMDGEDAIEWRKPITVTLHRRSGDPAVEDADFHPAYTISYSGGAYAVTTDATYAMETLDGEGHRFRIRNLAVHAANDAPYTYYLTEGFVSGFAAAYSPGSPVEDSAPNGGTITNSVDSSQVKDIRVRKVWAEDGDDHSSDTAVIQLFRKAISEQERTMVFNLSTRFYYSDGVTPAPGPADGTNRTVNMQVRAQYNGTNYPSSAPWATIGALDSPNLPLGAYGTGAPKSVQYIVNYDDYAAYHPLMFYHTNLAKLSGMNVFDMVENGYEILGSYGGSSTYFQWPQDGKNVNNMIDRTTNIVLKIVLNEAPPTGSGTVATTFIPQDNCEIPVNVAMVDQVTLTGNAEYTFSNLPTTGDGVTYEYYVREVVATCKGKGVTADYVTDGNTVTITNTVDRFDSASLEVAKEWRDASGNMMAAWPSGQTITLKLSGMLEGSSQQTFRTLGETGNDTLLTFEGIAPGMTAITREVGGATLTLTCATEGEGDSAVHSIRIEGLPPTDGTTAWVYWFEEAPVSGYLTSYENEGASTMPGACDGGKIINALAPYVLPSTGGPGTTLYTFTGLSVMLFALASLLRKRRYYSDHQN